LYQHDATQIKKSGSFDGAGIKNMVFWWEHFPCVSGLIFSALAISTAQ